MVVDCLGAISGKQVSQAVGRGQGWLAWVLVDCLGAMPGEAGLTGRRAGGRGSRTECWWTVQGPCLALLFLWQAQTGQQSPNSQCQPGPGSWRTESVQCPVICTFPAASTWLGPSGVRSLPSRPLSQSGFQAELLRGCQTQCPACFFPTSWVFNCDVLPTNSRPTR